MDYLKLGKTDIEVSVMALGCWPFAGGTVWGEQDDGVSVATAHAALDLGINFFDTAEGYENGYSEEVLGKALVGRRHEAVIATKVSASHLSAEEVEQACERSLKRMQTDYIDLYQIHWPSRKVPLEESIAALERLKQQGKIRAIGVSNFAVDDMAAFLSIGHYETNQLPFGLLWRAIEHEIQPMCVEKGLGIICYSPLAQGLLTGRYASGDEVYGGLARTRWYSGERATTNHGEPGCEAEVFAALNRIRQIAQKVGEPMANVALAWLRRQPGVTSMLVGARTPEEIRQDVGAADLSLSDEVMRALEDATGEVKRKIGPNADMWMAESRMR